MAIVSRLGKPDLFITFTCNPKWPEITKYLIGGQTAADRPDLTTWVFAIKLRALLDDLHLYGMLGKNLDTVGSWKFRSKDYYIAISSSSFILITSLKHL
jgi:hypothetical protein